MPSRARRPCTHPGCPELVTSGRCDRHRRQRQRLHDRGRMRGSRRIYSTTRWQRFRRWFLQQVEPLCRFCKDAGRTVPASEVDHIETLDDAPDRAFDATNCRGLCKPCHSRRTAIDQRGWGKSNNAEQEAQ